MAESSSSTMRLSEGFEAEQQPYRPVSRLAVLALAFGLLSFTAFIHPLLWTVPALGALFSLLALRRIAHCEWVLVGRRVAFAGLALSILLGAAAPTRWTAYRWQMRREAGPIAESWFAHLQRGEPHKAHQITVPPYYRQPADDLLWQYYRNNPDMAALLKEYVAEPTIRTLLALGENARVRYYDYDGLYILPRRELLTLRYSVTCDDAGEPTTFLVRVNLERRRIEGKATEQWQITKVLGPAD